MTREKELVEWIVEQAPDAGDDCAVLDCEPWGTLLVTTDSVIDQVHSSWEQHGAEAFGYCAVARGLSDVAAMAGEPLWAVVAACLPRGVTEKQARGILLGAQKTGCRIVGGDVAFGPTPYVAATVLGRAHEQGPVLRDGARVGDLIVVSGPLGSRDPMTFEPRVMEARTLVESCDVGAMIDISDGLSTDLHHMLEASGTGCRIDPASIPRNAGVPLAQALNRGEDYELLATVRPGRLPPPFTAIGEITEGEAWFGDELLVAGGWEHGA